MLVEKMTMNVADPGGVECAFVIIHLRKINIQKNIKDENR